MSHIRKRCSLLFKSGVEKLKAAGIDPTPEDVVHLWETSRAVIEGERDSGIALIDIPVQVGNVTLHPRTNGAVIWWDQYGSKWFKDEPDDEVLAVAWMLANSRKPEVLRAVTTKTACRMELVKWQLGIASDVTLNELADGIERLCGRFEIDEETGKRIEVPSRTEWGEIIAALCATYHRPAEYFLWEISADLANELMEKRPPPPGYEKPNGDSLSRYGDFLDAVRSIRERHSDGS